MLYRLIENNYNQIVEGLITLEMCFIILQVYKNLGLSGESLRAGKKHMDCVVLQ